MFTHLFFKKCGVDVIEGIIKIYSGDTILDERRSQQVKIVVFCNSKVSLIIVSKTQ